MSIADPTESAPPFPSLKDRLLAASLYFGSVSVFGWRKSWRGNDYLDHHVRQALSVQLVFLIWFALFVSIWALLSALLVQYRGWYESAGLEPKFFTIMRRLFLAWFVVWVFGTGWALRGSWGDIPLVGRLAKRPWIMRATLVTQSTATAILVVLACTAVHATILTRADDAPAKAYMLYDDLNFYPRWLFNLGFYPITVAATLRWGADSVVVAPLTKEHLAKAFVDGKFVFVSSHGGPQGLFTTNFALKPLEAAPLGVGGDLQFVYVTGCDSGTLAAEWEATLAPAEVVTFDRLSAILEHIVWLVFRGASKIGQLE